MRFRKRKERGFRKRMRSGEKKEKGKETDKENENEKDNEKDNESGNEKANQALTPTLIRPDFDCPVAHVAAGTDSTLVVDREGTLMVWGLAGKRAKLPDCVERAIRARFPDPACGPHCDLLRACEAAGHYSGFVASRRARGVCRFGRQRGWQPLWSE